MTITCPSCDARFRDPPEEISLKRPLQCSKCEHEWIRALDGAERIVIDTPPLEPTMESLIDDADNAIVTNLPVVVGALATTSQEDEDDKPVFVDREIEPVTGKRSSLLPAIGLAAITLITGTISLQELIVENVPQAYSAYSAAGLASPAPGLEISTVETTKTTKDGIRQLIIRGEIENVAAHNVPVPPIKLTMRGESNVRLYAWTVSAAKDQLKAGERSRFTAIARDYPDETVDVEIEFLPAKGK